MKETQFESNITERKQITEHRLESLKKMTIQRYGHADYWIRVRLAGGWGGGRFCINGWEVWSWI
jgi:hypothetical protein